MNGTGQSAPALTKFNWNPFFGGITAAAAVVVCIITLLSWHEARPHDGVVTTERYQKDMDRLLADVREIRQIVSHGSTGGN